MIMASSVNMVDEFESSFQNCISLISGQEQSNVSPDSDELKSSMEQSVNRFVDASRQLDCFFVQKRILLSKCRPEPHAKEDLTDLRAELQRKEMLIQRHNEKLQHWISTLSGRSGAPVGGSPSSAGAALGTPQSALLPGTPQSQSAASMATPMGVSTPTGAPAFSGPLAYLEQTTSSIGSAPTRGGS